MTKPVPHRLRCALIVAGVSLLSAAAYSYLHVGDDSGLPLFTGACERIKESGIPPHPGDWWCTSPEWHIQANVVIGALLIGVGFAIPVAILAATGRRLSALWPALPALFLAQPLLGLGSGFFWLTDDVHWYDDDLLVGLAKRLAAPALSLALLSAPGLAVGLTMRRDAPAKPRVPDPYRGVAAVICVLAAVVVILLTPRILALRLEDRILMELWSFRTVAPLAAAIGIFGALLGQNRRWWPWSLAVPAFFLSYGPSAVRYFEWNPEGFQTWTMFGLVVPLFLIGLIGSGWRGLAARLSRRYGAVEENEIGSSDSYPVHKLARITMSAFGAGLLVVSMGLFVMDPMAARFNETLPEFNVMREQAQDVRARMNLLRAMDTMIAYKHRKGTYQGFTPRVGAQLDPGLEWKDGLPPVREFSTPDTGPYPPTLAVSIVTSSSDVARVATASRRDAAYCLQLTRSGLRYGFNTNDSPGLTSDVAFVGALRSAVSNCGSTTWTPEPFEPPPLPRCVARTSGFLICRMAQVLIFKILKEPEPLPRSSSGD
ncbi:MAG: hypothetical protein WD757_07315 [Actinomycetota bacterium]